jgi:hypothetical protein
MVCECVRERERESESESERERAHPDNLSLPKFTWIFQSKSAKYALEIYIDPSGNKHHVAQREGVRKRVSESQDRE